MSGLVGEPIRRNPFGTLVVSVAVFVVSVLGCAEVMAAGLFWSHLGLLFLLMASAVYILASMGTIAVYMERKKLDGVWPEAEQESN